VTQLPLLTSTVTLQFALMSSRIHSRTCIQCSWFAY
jgi:hypothetical protein